MGTLNSSKQCEVIIPLTLLFFSFYPAYISCSNVNNRNTQKRCELCSKLTTETPERRHRPCSSAFIVNFEHISQPFLVFLLLTLSK